MKFQRDAVYLLVIIILIGIAGQFYYTYKYQPQHEIEVYYNHDRQLNQEIIDEIKDADKFVYFAVYTFTRDDIKDALLGAKYRGLTVVGLTDRDQYNQIDQQKSIINELRKDDIPVYEQDHSGIMHTKAIVTDKAYASGSYNWTAAATNINDEVLEVGRDPAMRQKYQSIIEEMFQKYRTPAS
jgi:phosphatidylserine/phosphatidylglycerophosphate/cardiolipin synthase-like enzyme